MYNKLFTKILDSSIWMESLETRIVWMTFIAAMDEDGFVQFASVGNVAHRARVGIEAASAAIKTLEAPDPNSSDPENDGRRLERVPGGWMVLNSQKYRQLVTRVVIQEQTKNRVRRFREKKRTGNAGVTLRNEPVTPSEIKSEAEADNRSISPRRPESIHDVCNRLTKDDPDVPAIDRLDEDLAFEEIRFRDLALPIRDRIQQVLDALPRSQARSPFSASRWLRTGQTGVPRSEGGLTVLRLTNDALEARARGVKAPKKRLSVPAHDRGVDHEVTEADLAWDPRLGPRPVDGIRS